MKAYLITMLVLHALAVVARLSMLSFSDYPRTVKNERWEDVLSLVTLSLVLFWTISLLS